jgi:hypothetical protein
MMSCTRSWNLSRSSAEASIPSGTWRQVFWLKWAQTRRRWGKALRHQDGGVLALKKYAHILGNAEITMMDKLGESLVRPSRKPVISELRTDAQSKKRSAFSA